jgi:hypothetical protein
MKKHQRQLYQNKLLRELKFLVFILFFTIIIPRVSATEELYTENIVTYVDEENQCIIAGFFARNSIEEIEVDMLRYEGFLGCFLVSHKDVMENLNEYMNPSEESDFSEVLVLMPETLIAFFYIDIDIEASQAHSDSLVGDFSSIYNMEIIEFLSFSQDIEENEFAHSITVNIYQSPTTLDEFISKYLQYFENYGGYVSTVPEDQLIPWSMPDSVDGSIVFTGYCNSEYLFEKFSVDQSMVYFDLDDVMGFAGYLGYYEYCEGVNGILDREHENSEYSDFSSVIKIYPSDESGEFILKMSSSVVISEQFRDIMAEELSQMGVKAEFGTFTEDNIQFYNDDEKVSVDVDVTEVETSYSQDESIDSNKQPDVTIQQSNKMGTLIQVSGVVLVIGFAVFVFQKHR